MEEHFTIRSGLLIVCVMLAVFCSLTEQRPRCPLPADCGANLEEDTPRVFSSKYRSVADDAAAIKLLMETLLMQHNEIADTTGVEREEEENATERPPIANVQHQNMGAEETTFSENTEENFTQWLPMQTSSVYDHVTERPTFQIALTNDGDTVPKKSINEHNDTASDNDKFDGEVTTMEPQPLASPLETNEYRFEITTISPELIMEMEPIQLSNSGEKVHETSQNSVSSTKINKKNTSSYLVNTPPTRSNEKKTKVTTTESPHVISRTQPFYTFTDKTSTATPLTSGNQEKNKIKLSMTTATTRKPDEKINSLKPVDDRDQNVSGEIELETLNRPISTSRPLALVTNVTHPSKGNESATSSRPNKKPINIIPASIVKKGHKPSSGVDKPQGSAQPGEVHNPIPNSVAAVTSSEPDDYLISALASLAGDEENNGDDEDEDQEEEEEEGDEEEEEGEEEEENEEEEEGEEEEEDEEEEYLFESAEENKERENFDYINSVDASDVISSVMEEMDALL